MKIANRVKCKGCGKYIGYYKDLGYENVAGFNMHKVGMSQLTKLKKKIWLESSK